MEGSMRRWREREEELVQRCRVKERAEKTRTESDSERKTTEKALCAQEDRQDRGRDVVRRLVEPDDTGPVESCGNR
ncbi:hypothetical protein NDU88_001795 [Pleurodeles waltl]|uniref:Uncharacterized protein n=1 Tax=Pleurodeles waltl TaxID=8319 RepID=A0AAV7U7F2_PLEWA|nr:hypothetical protein NDU88_001795 [Pleurodeles waltl]